MGRGEADGAVKAGRAKLALPLAPSELPRWLQAAEFEGFSTVADWLASLADAQCRDLGDSLHHPALVWKRGRFHVKEQGEAKDTVVDVEVEGVVAAPFGICRDPAYTHKAYFLLVHLPTGGHVLRLDRRKDCQALARELAPLRLPWACADPQRVMDGPDAEKVREVIKRYREEP
jgi:hypothetical protein